MANQFHLNAQARSEAEQGKGASRRLRKQKRVPAIIYGGGEDPLAITLDIDKLRKALESEAFFSHILNIAVEGASEDEQVVIKDLQRHPAKGYPMHADFQRIVKGQVITMRIPVHFVGEATSVGKKAGGIMSTLVSDVEVSCIPSKLPEYLEVDVSGLDIGDSLHLSDVALPEGVVIPELEHEDGTDRTIVNMQAPRKEEPKDDAAAEVAEGEEASEADDAADSAGDE